VETREVLLFERVRSDCSKTCWLSSRSFGQLLPIFALGPVQEVSRTATVGGAKARMGHNASAGLLQSLYQEALDTPFTVGISNADNESVGTQIVKMPAVGLSRLQMTPYS